MLIRGIARGGHAPQLWIEWIFVLKKKLAKVTLFSLPEVFSGPQICQKWRWRQAPAGGGHDAPPDLIVDWGGGYPFHNPPPRHLCSRHFGT